MSYRDRHNPPDHIDPSRLRVGAEPPPTTADPLAVLEPVLRDVYQRIRDVTRDNLTDRCDAADAILRLATANASLLARARAAEESFRRADKDLVLRVAHASANALEITRLEEENRELKKQRNAVAMLHDAKHNERDELRTANASLRAELEETEARLARAAGVADEWSFEAKVSAVEVRCAANAELLGIVRALALAAPGDSFIDALQERARAAVARLEGIGG